MTVFLSTVVVAAHDEPNPPDWPSSVRVFSPGDDELCASAAAEAYARNGGQKDHGQFSRDRYALLFKPGSYSCDVPVGYYTQVLGLGSSPDDVVFTGAKGVHSEEGDYNATVGALNTFWRGAENFRSEATYDWGTAKGMLWAVSQAAPLRRVHVTGSLALFQFVLPTDRPPVDGEPAGRASGGFLADSVVDGTLAQSGQQQWLTRNSNLGKVHTAAWNPVFVGVEGAPARHGCGTGPGKHATVVESAPRLAEKPFVGVDPDDARKFVLHVPTLKQASVGAAWGWPTESVGFERVYLATAADSAAAINAKLAVGLHVVLAPGVYALDVPLRLATPGQVLLGLGLATLVAAGGAPCITVANVGGVRVAGVLLQAGPLPTPTLLQWGEGAGGAGNASDPGVLSDIFARVGGPDSTEVQAEAMLIINASHVIGDNLWLWRADHTARGAVVGGANPCAAGLLVHGDDVTLLGTAVEHAQGDQLRWYGERGRSYFVQMELDYDYDGGAPPGCEPGGCVGYRVGADVQDHDAVGVGVYHNLNAPVTVGSGISAPAHLEGRFVAPLAVHLDGRGTMSHVINDQGPATGPEQRARTNFTEAAIVCAPRGVRHRRSTAGAAARLAALAPVGSSRG